MVRALTPAIAVLIISSAATASGQAPAPQHPSAGSFETASIEPSSSGVVDYQLGPKRFIARNATLGELIERAHGVPPWEIAGGPDWARVDRFTVQATTADDASEDEMRLMLRALLAERFALQLARDTRSVPVYELTAADVRRLKRTSRPGDPPAIDIELVPDQGVLRYRYKGRNATMGDLARALSPWLRKPVIDATRLADAFDFQFDFSYDDVFGQDPGLPTVFVALEKQVGLRLVPGTGTIPVYVIQRASKPTAGAAR